MLSIQPLGRSSLRTIRNLVTNLDTFFPSATFVDIPIVETRTVVTEVEVKAYEDPEEYVTFTCSSLSLVSSPFANALPPPKNLALDHLPSSSTIELSSTCESACSSPRSRMTSPSGRPPLAVTNSIRASSLGQGHRRGPPPPLPTRRSPIAVAPVPPVVSKPANIVRGQGHTMGTPPPLPARPSPRGVAASPPPAVVNSVRVSKIVRGSPPPLPSRRSPHGFAPMIPPPLAVVNPTRVPTIVLGQGHPMSPLPSLRQRQLSSSPLGVAPRYPPRSRCKGDRSL